jgi:serine/threonine protein kinase
MHARDFQPGQPVPGTVYRVVRLIGSGGMGTVYDVEDTTIGKRYVLKTLHPQLGAREDLARRMQNEARTLARLNHPNIVEVITAGVTGDEYRLPYYVMERLNGQSLRLVLAKKGQIELAHLFHIGIDLLDALDHAHDKGVIHRDVKPDNIFLHRTPAGVTITKLLDFGIVSMLDGAGETAGRFLGTLRYAAPEQLRGDKPTPKMDVYAAGLVLYESLAGRGPFDDEGEPQRIGAAHLHKAPPPLSRFVAVPGELESLLMAALAKNPEDRPRDAFSFAASLRNLKRLGRAGHDVSESTESRATAPAMLGPASARAPSLEPPTASGPFRIALRGSGPPLSKTTLRGMTPPSMTGAALGGATSASSLAIDDDAFDRSGATRSAADPSSPLPAMTTEAISQIPTLTEPVEPVESAERGEFEASKTDVSGEPTPPEFGGPPLAWPNERGPIRSEEPHVRSLRAPRDPRAPWRAVAGAVALAGVAVSSVAFLGAPGRGNARAARAAAAASSLPLPRPDSVPSATAGPIAELPSPASDITPAASGERAQLPAGSSIAPTSLRLDASGADAAVLAPPAPSPKPSARASSSVRPHTLDRPGPGF